jgi:transmembrane sensor
MGKVHKLPDSATTEREASDWIARMHADDVSADDRERFEAWLRAHPCNEKAYAELLATWNALVKAGPIVRAVSFGQSMNAAAKVRAPRWRLASLAAALAVIAFGAAWHLFKQQEDTRFQTATGEQVAVTLPDGSSFNLNTNSRVQVAYTQHSRIVRLERGEAFFTVAHDTQRPFWVHAGDRWVRAVGTAFNVYLRPASVQVTVSEGTVKVVNAAGPESPPADTAYERVGSAGTAGEQADLRGHADVIRALNAAQIKRLLAWRNSTLDFQGEPLGDVVNELMRYTTLKIEIKDDSLRELPVGGTFQASPAGAESLLKMLEDGFGTKVHRVGADHVYIEGPPESRAGE